MCSSYTITLNKLSHVDFPCGKQQEILGSGEYGTDFDIPGTV